MTDPSGARDAGIDAPSGATVPNYAPDLTRLYRTDRIEVRWYAGRCIHSGACVRGLPAVFDVHRRPWVDPSAAEPDAIAETVLRCPSGALHFVRLDGGAQETPDKPTTFTRTVNGPLLVRGDIEVRSADGTVLRHDTRSSMCRCGLAHKMPFCDNRCRMARWHEPESTERRA